jgi:hypothetical protein
MDMSVVRVLGMIDRLLTWWLTRFLTGSDSAD